MKKFLSMALSLCIAGGSLQPVFNQSSSTFMNANAGVYIESDHEKYVWDYSQEEIDDSDIKPEIFLTIDGEKYGKVLTSGDAGKRLDCTLEVKDAAGKYGPSQMWIKFDKRLDLGVITEGKAISNMFLKLNQPFIENYTTDGKAFLSNNVIFYENGFRADTVAVGNNGKDGTMWKFEVTIPYDAKPGDVYGFDIFYFNNDEYYSEFYSVESSDETAGLMQAYAFTRGIFNESVNNKFSALPADIESCPGLASIYKSYDGYIGIAGESPSNLPGDVNCDGKVDIMDATDLQNWMKGLNTFEMIEQGEINADVYKPGSGITDEDLIALRNYLNGTLTELPSEVLFPSEITTETTTETTSTTTTTTATTTSTTTSTTTKKPKTTTTTSETTTTTKKPTTTSTTSTTTTTTETTTTTKKPTTTSTTSTTSTTTETTTTTSETTTTTTATTTTTSETTTTTTATTTTTSETTSTTTETTTTTTNEPPVEEPTLGDVNGDDIINAVDASRILVLYANINSGDVEVTEQDMAVCDVNGDNMLNAVDASLVLAYYADLAKNPELTLTVFLEERGKKNS